MSKVFIGCWLVVLILIAAYIRVHGVSDYYYNEDEAMHIGIAQGKALSEVLRFSLYETHPPLGHILRHYWMQVSDGLAFERSLSLLFGLLLIPLYYLIGTTLKDKVAGMCCAALAAFSYGCILESYVVRNYALFVFLISLSLYFYLLWRKEKAKASLACYIISCMLAALTHFSAIFTVFCIAAYETLRAYRKKESTRRQCIWIGVNLLLGIFATGVYLFWVFYGTVLQYPNVKISSLPQLIFLIIANPFIAISYSSFGKAVFPLAAFMIFLPSVRKDTSLQSFAGLTGTALLLGMILLGIKAYFPAGSRHGLWVLPFILPLLGWMMANTIEELHYTLHKKHNIYALPFLLAAMMVTGAVTYDPKGRFTDAEYKIRNDIWQQAIGYTDTLDNHSMLVAARYGAVLFSSVYPYLDKDALVPGFASVVMPYHHTHLLFNPFYGRVITGGILAGTLNEANDHGLLKGIDTLVFFKPKLDGFQDAENVIPYLLTCSALKKTIVSFPPFEYPPLKKGTVLSDAEEELGPIAFMAISKKDFFDQVVPLEGKAHYCLERRNIKD